MAYFVEHFLPASLAFMPRLQLSLLVSHRTVHISSNYYSNEFRKGPMLFGYLIRMDESADAGRILTAVPQSDWKRPAGRPYTPWLATMKNDLS